MRAYFATLFASLILIAGTNYSVDVGHRWRKAAIAGEVIDGWIAGEALYAPANFEERKLRGVQIERMPAPDVLVLGSSRAMGVSRDSFRDDRRVYNAGLSHAAIEDLAIVWQSLRESGKIPSLVLLQIDPWTLGPHSELDAWRTQSAVLDRFAAGAEKNEPAAARPTPARSLIAAFARGLSETKDLLSWSVLKASLRHLRRGAPAEGEWRNLPTERIPADRSAWLPDGSFKYGSHDFPVESSGPPYGGGNLYAIELVQWKPRRENEALFDRLLSEFRRSGVRVVVWIPPYRSDFMRAVRFSDGYARWRAHTAKRLARAVTDGEVAAVCDELGREPPCPDGEFLDFMHAVRPCVRRMIAPCLERSGLAREYGSRRH